MAVWIKHLLFALLVGLLGVLANLTPLGLQIEEDFGLPWLFRLRGATPAPPEVVVVAIDKASSSATGFTRHAQSVAPGRSCQADQ